MERKIKWSGVDQGEKRGENAPNISFSIGKGEERSKGTP